MKKILSSLISFVMVLSMSTTAFAAEGSVTNQGIGEQTIDVTARYTASTSTEPVYSVDIAWDNMTFTYSESGVRIWNPENHTYTANRSGEWDKTTADITVTNHSNADVTVKLTYTADTANGNTGVTGTLSNAGGILAAGAEGKPDEAEQIISTLTVSGIPNGNVTADGVRVGTITVTISK